MTGRATGRTTRQLERTFGVGSCRRVSDFMRIVATGAWLLGCPAIVGLLVWSTCTIAGPLWGFAASVPLVAVFGIYGGVMAARAWTES